MEISHKSKRCVDQEQNSDITSRKEQKADVKDFESSISSYSPSMQEELAIDSERIVILPVVDWGGEEKARVAIRIKDKVEDAKNQILEQTGFTLKSQRLVVGEVELEGEMTWDIFPDLRDGTRIQLTVVIDELNAETDRSALLCMVKCFGKAAVDLINSWGSTKHLSSFLGITVNDAGRVTEIHIQNLGLGGFIAPEVGNLTELKILNLANNKICGAIPFEISNLRALHYLDLSGNILTGNIPREVGNLRNLRTLLLGNNRLAGGIPVEIGNLQFLIAVSLQRNRLEGIIPSEFGNLLRLHECNLSDNQLSGSVPHEFTHLKEELTFLSLEGNNLTGGPTLTLQDTHLQEYLHNLL